MTSMFRSENFPSAPSFGGARIRSISSSLASVDIAARQARRIAIASSSSQSWMIALRRYASPPAGTDSKKVPPTMLTRPATDARTGSAPATTCGWSKSTPCTVGWAPRIAARRVPLPPPTSTIVPKRPKSYASRTARFAAPVKEAIASSKIALSSGLSARQSQTSVPWSERKEFSPLRMLCSRLPQALQK